MLFTFVVDADADADAATAVVRVDVEFHILSQRLSSQFGCQFCFSPIGVPEPVSCLNLPQTLVSLLFK